MCPVDTYKLYLEKLNPDNPFLWQRGKTIKLHYTDPVWYTTKIGHGPIERFMTYLSKEMGLATVYTNQCIRATCLTYLDRAGYEARHIIAVSSHKSENTIKSYSRKCPEHKLKEMSNTIAGTLPQKKEIVTPPPPAAKRFKFNRSPTATVSVNPDNVVAPLQERQQNVNPFSLEQERQQNVNPFSLEQERQQNVNPLSLEFPTINTTDLDLSMPFDQFENSVDDDDMLLRVLQETEQSLVAQPTNTVVTNVSNNNSNNNPQSVASLIPKMNFPNSNVTINFNFPK
jgi:hypothetical protein